MLEDKWLVRSAQESRWVAEVGFWCQWLVKEDTLQDQSSLGEPRLSEKLKFTNSGRRPEWYWAGRWPAAPQDAKKGALQRSILQFPSCFGEQEAPFPSQGGKMGIPGASFLQSFLHSDLGAFWK